MTYPSALPIATAQRTDAKTWRAETISWSDLLDRLRTPATEKECGGYVLGTLRGARRSKTTILDRNTVALDADTDVDLPDILDRLDALGYEAVVHTTWQSAPDAVRVRILLPLDRSVAPDEYHAIATQLVHTLGEASFDPTTVQPERFMYWPSAQHPDWFQFHHLEGVPLPSAALLDEWDPDLTKLPTPRTRKRDPQELAGVPGAFNRVFTFDEAIELYELPYEKVSEGRWHLAGAKAIAGLNQIADGFVFSHHVTDPAHGRTCSAFDLVRLHRYGHLDEQSDPNTPINKLPSHLAFEDEARTNPRVMTDMLGVDFENLGDDEAWLAQLDRDRHNRVKNTIQNWDLLRDNDPVLRKLYFNELTLSVEADGDLPWREMAEGLETFTAVDTSELAQHVERTYQLPTVSRERVKEAVSTAAHRRRRNPVAEWLLRLRWDGTDRLETCLPGVTPTLYTRTVARKCFVAAAARMLDPGCKWDHTLILYGDEGLGKTFWIDKLSRGYSASLGRIGDKDTLIAMQRSWIMVSDEGHTISKADADAQKEFLTRTKDVFRMPYDREAAPHPRHCVIWGSTNDKIFLNRMEGNRRFLIVHCEKRVDFDALTDDYVEQVWAEAVYRYRAGEKLFLDEAESALAKVNRETYTEEDVLRGIVAEYLERDVPLEWESWSPERRAGWLALGDDENFTPGVRKQNEVCTLQLWCEAMARRRGDHTRRELIDLAKVMHDMPGWKTIEGRRRIPHYGPQLLFIRTSNVDQDLAELL